MKKGNLKFAVRARLIWTAIIIFLLFTSVSSYIFKEQERKLRVFTQNKLIATLEETYILQSRLLDVNHAKSRLEMELQKERNVRDVVESQLSVAIRENQELKTALTKVREAVDLDKIVVEDNGKITRIGRDNSFKVDLGSDNELKKGDILSIYRDNILIGKAEVSKLGKGSSTVSVLPQWYGVKFKKNDEVKIEK